MKRRMTIGLMMAAALAGCGKAPAGQGGAQESPVQAGEEKPAVAAFDGECDKAKQGQMDDATICMGGDPAVIAMIPAWARPPAKVKLLSTTISPGSIGYGAEFDGPLSEIEPLYRAQIAAHPGVTLAPQGGGNAEESTSDHGKAQPYQAMLVGADPNDPTHPLLSLTPQRTSSGGWHLEIRFFLIRQP